VVGQAGLVGHDRARGVALARLALAAALAVGFVLLVVNAPAFRDLEAWSSQPLTALVTRGGTSHIDDSAVVLFGLGTPGARGLRVTPECSALALVLPVVGVVAFLIGFGRRFSVGRVLMAGLGTCAVILTVNTIRVALIAMATQRWGAEGYEVSHLFVGSVVSLVGFSIGLIVGFKILASGDPAVRRIPDLAR
jgi:exosortase/archaeosortase family protein